MAALLRRPAAVLIMVALMLIGLAGSALGSGRDVVLDAEDLTIDDCYSRAEFRDALDLARADERLYANSIDIIKEAEITHVTVPGRPCGSGRPVPARAVAVSSSGATTLWGAAALLVVAVALGAGALARRMPGGGGGDR